MEQWQEDSLVLEVNQSLHALESYGVSNWLGAPLGDWQRRFSNDGVLTMRRRRVRHGAWRPLLGLGMNDTADVF